MTHSNDENQNPNSSADTHTTGFGKSLNWLSLVFALLALSLACFGGFELIKIKKLNKENSKILNELKTQAEVNVINGNQQQQNVHSMQAQLQELMIQTNPTEMVLTDVIHLIHSAHMDLNVNTNISGAINYLGFADSQILSLHNPEFDDLRSLLKQNLLTLKSLSIPDRNGLIIELDTIASTISSLPVSFKSFIAPAPAAVNPTDEPYRKDNWKARLTQTLKSLKSFVVIRNNDQLPILRPEEQDLLKLIIQTKLIETQWAVLNFDAQLYQHNLELIQQWLGTYYATNLSTQSLLAEIQKLQSINLELKLPNLLDMVEPIQKHLKSYQTLTMRKLETPSNLPKIEPATKTPTAPVLDNPAKTPPRNSSIEA